ncbi:MAG TPA: DUF459 domain-containing protein [Gaiellaceae bacterium]|nr:DUF459 domain-containing protein [Gaiellaceae bacterium]
MRTPAARGVVLLAAMLALGGLLDARGLRKQAEIQPPGVQRDVALALTRPLLDVSSFLRLDRPRHALQVAIGRRDEDRVDTSVDFGPPPVRHTPRPAPQPVAHTPTPEPKPKPKPKARFTASHPLRIWVAGDSLAEVPGQALERAASGREPIRILRVESRLSTGLGRPDLYNWFVRIRQAIPALHPNVAVLSFGADDAHNYMSGVPKGRTIGKLGSPTWDAEYLRRVSGVTRELNRAGIYVVWLGLPIPRGRGFFYSFQKVNAVLREAAAEAPHAAYLSTWQLLSTKNGKYADYLRDGHGRLVQMRASDGVHYTQAAGDLIARTLLQRLGRVYTLGG